MEPVRADVLQKILAKWSSGHVRISPVGECQWCGSEKSTGLVLDWEQLVRNVCNDRDFAGSIVSIFVNDACKRLQKLGELIRAGNVSEVQRAAHTLKGASANICALEFSSLAAGIESLARERRMNEVEKVFGKLKRAFEELRKQAGNPV